MQSYRTRIIGAGRKMVVSSSFDLSNKLIKEDKNKNKNHHKWRGSTQGWVGGGEEVDVRGQWVIVVAFSSPTPLGRTTRIVQDAGGKKE